MSEVRHPTIGELTRALGRLADRVLESEEPQLENFISQRLHDIINKLKWFFPGFDEPPNRDAAKSLTRAAQTALRQCHSRYALSRALRALSFSPHEPVTWHVVGAASFELGALESALRALKHSLWIRPRNRVVELDLEELTAFFEEQCREDDTDED